MLFGAEPVRVEAAVVREPGTGVDVLTSAILDFDDGRRDVHLLDPGRARPARPHLRHDGPDLDRDPVQHPARPADADLRDGRRRPAGRARDRDADVRRRPTPTRSRPSASPPRSSTACRRRSPPEDAVANMRVIERDLRGGRRPRAREPPAARPDRLRYAPRREVDSSQPRHGPSPRGARDGNPDRPTAAPSFGDRAPGRGASPASRSSSSSWRGVARRCVRDLAVGARGTPRRPSARRISSTRRRRPGSINTLRRWRLPVSRSAAASRVLDCDGDGRPDLYLAGGAGPGRAVPQRQRRPAEPCGSRRSTTRDRPHRRHRRLPARHRRRRHRRPRRAPDRRERRSSAGSAAAGSSAPTSAGGSTAATGSRRPSARPGRARPRCRRWPSATTSATRTRRIPSTCAPTTSSSGPAADGDALRRADPADAVVVRALDALQRLGSVGPPRPADQQRPALLQRPERRRGPALADRAGRAAAAVHAPTTAGRPCGSRGWASAATT